MLLNGFSVSRTCELIYFIILASLIDRFYDFSGEHNITKWHNVITSSDQRPDTFDFTAVNVAHFKMVKPISFNYFFLVSFFSCVHGALCEICQHFQGEICTAPQNLLAALERQGENTTKLREDCPGSG